MLVSYKCDDDIGRCLLSRVKHKVKEPASRSVPEILYFAPSLCLILFSELSQIEQDIHNHGTFPLPTKRQIQTSTPSASLSSLQPLNKTHTPFSFVRSRYKRSPQLFRLCRSRHLHSVPPPLDPLPIPQLLPYSAPQPIPSQPFIHNIQLHTHYSVSSLPYKLFIV